MSIIKRISLFKRTLCDVTRTLTTKKGIKMLYGVSLYRNAVYLMLDNAIPALSGFAFWVIAARLYSAENVGIASATISVTGLLVAFSTLGLGNTLIRFLPNAREQTGQMINSSFTVGSLVALLSASIFIVGLNLWAPALISVRDNFGFLIMFVVFIPVILVDGLSGTIYIACRRSDLTLLQDIIASLLRFIPLLLLVTFLPNLGIFCAWGLGILVAAIIGVFIFIPITQNGYKPTPSINKKILGEMVRYSASNYLASLLAMMSGSILPLIVLNRLGAESNAYFYISWTISGIIATVPSAITTSLFAEGAHDEKTLGNHVKRSLMFICILLTPLIIIVLFFGKWLLLIFGTKYAQNGLPVLQVLTISALPLSVNYLYFTIKRIEKAMGSVIMITRFVSLAVLIFSYVFLPRIGLLAVGIGWLGTNTIAALFIIVTWSRKKSLL